jgi:hypothetical protein
MLGLGQDRPLAKAIGDEAGRGQRQLSCALQNL